MNIAALSDTHGLLRPEVLATITGCHAIIHAGDVGDPSILSALAEIAPTYAIRGNIDKGELEQSLPGSLLLTFDGTTIFVIHELEQFERSSFAEPPRLVVFGHSHRPSFFEKDGISFLNPGSIGPRRFKLPISWAIVDWMTDAFSHEFITL